MDRFIKRVFISQPTNELRSEEEIQKDRDHAFMVARARIASEEFGEIETEVEALDDDFYDGLPHPPLYYLGALHLADEPGGYCGFHQGMDGRQKMPD